MGKIDFFKLEWNPFKGQFRYSEIGEETFTYFPNDEEQTPGEENEWGVTCEKMAKSVMIRFMEMVTDKYNLFDGTDPEPYPSWEIIRAELQSLT